MNGNLTSTDRVVLLRNLEIAEHLAFPNAEIILAPRLNTLTGSLIARAATYVDMRTLSAIFGGLDLQALAYADFENLGLAAGDINLPAARGIGFPTLKLHGQAYNPIGRGLKVIASGATENGRSSGNSGAYRGWARALRNSRKN